MARTKRSPARKRHVGARHHSDIRELRIPAGMAEGYPGIMTGSRGGREHIAAAQLARVAAFMKSKCTEDQPESWHVEKSGIPQATFSSAKRGVKLGWSTARRLAQYFGWGDDVDGFLDGIPPAGAFASLEEGLEMGYPERGLVLDRFRGIVPDDVLREVQAIELAPGQRLDAFGWAELCIDAAKRRRILAKVVPPTNDRPLEASGHFPQPHPRPRK